MVRVGVLTGVLAGDLTGFKTGWFAKKYYRNARSSTSPGEQAGPQHFGVVEQHSLVVQIVEDWSLILVKYFSGYLGDLANMI